jgi:hypothetical protein
MVRQAETVTKECMEQAQEAEAAAPVVVVEMLPDPAALVDVLLQVAQLELADNFL